MIKTKLMLTACASALLAACTSNAPEIPDTELYTRKFVKEFGVMDSRQDWNNASRGNVQVSTSKASRIRVTTMIGNHNYLLADYADVQGKRTLEFDIPKGITDITVSDGTNNYDTKVGGSVEFSSKSRGVYTGETVIDDVTINVKVADEKYWRVLSEFDINSFNRVMPEDGINLYHPGVNKDFMFRSTGPIIIYPLYWNTSETNTIGLVYIDKNGNKQYVRLFTNYKSPDFDMNTNVVGRAMFRDEDIITVTYDHFYQSEALKEWAGSRTFNGKTLDQLGQNKEDVLALLNELRGENFNYILKTDHPELDIFSVIKLNHGDIGNRFYGSEPVFNAGSWTNDWNSDHISFICVKNGATYNESKAIEGAEERNFLFWNKGTWDENRSAVLSKGIVVDVPVGIRYAMYLYRGVYEEGVERDSNKLFYSLSRYNPDYRVRRDETGNPIKSDGSLVQNRNQGDVEYMSEKAMHAATWIGPKFGWTWLSFEDCRTDEDSWNIDINDMVFIIRGATTDTATPDIINPDDPDPDPDPTPDPTPIKWLVACEDLGAMDDFDFNDVVFEIEHVSGQTEATITPLAAGGTLETYLMRDGNKVNETEWHALFGSAPSNAEINASAITKTAEPFKITVPADFSLSSSNAGDGYKANMGGFHINVKRDDGEISEITPPGEGEAPQMILIYQSADKKWCWPKERHSIKDAYPKFANWMNGGDYTVNPTGENWYDEAVSNHLVQRN